MKRLVFEIALFVGVLVMGLEAVRYRNAVLEANIDRNRAWNTVIDLRHKLEKCTGEPSKPEPPASAAPAPGEKPIVPKL